MSESKQQHMQTPWILGGSAAWSEAAKDRGPIFTCDIREGTHVPVGTNQANARFIVRAVNSHEALLTACKAALEDRSEYNGPCDHEPQYGADCLQCELRKAISLAEKEELDQ